MARWDLSKLPEGRKPLPDEWFAERAQMQDRIKELEYNLSNARLILRYASERLEEEDKNARRVCSAMIQTFLKELTGDKDE
ncbi:MAG: hypothetical protein VW518_10345 [Burkholderiaceae bacterium]